ncbi:c-type cytochrome [Hydrocarboniphaga sp.]|uniref:c-type cytochrome n=1 Tax=Hydrocarboniphaga sp. TaxID=2033016 RepID=UPI003D13E2F6
MKRPFGVILIMAMLLGAYAPATFADAGNGADSFDSNCAECHSVANPLRNKKGPGLFGISGRPAAQLADFDYSDALKASGITWTKTTLDAYIKHPKGLVPGGKMKFDGLDDAKERSDLIEFLESRKKD